MPSRLKTGLGHSRQFGRISTMSGPPLAADATSGCDLLRWATSAHSTAILTQQSEDSIFAVSWPSGTQLIDLQIEHAVEGTLP